MKSALHSVVAFDREINRETRPRGTIESVNGEETGSRISIILLGSRCLAEQCSARAPVSIEQKKVSLRKNNRLLSRRNLSPPFFLVY